MIFYFSGTGNTEWAAEQLALATHDVLRYIPDELKNGTLEYTLQEDERLGFCFPTHGWQPPKIVRQFIRKAQFHTPSSPDDQHPTYVYALTTCGDNMGHAMRILNKELNHHGLHTDAAFAVVMPESNVCFSFLHLIVLNGNIRKWRRQKHTCHISARWWSIASGMSRNWSRGLFPIPTLMSSEVIITNTSLPTGISGWMRRHVSSVAYAPSSVLSMISRGFRPIGNMMAPVPIVLPAIITVPATLSIGGR